MSEKKSMVLGKENINLLVTAFPSKKKEFKSFTWNEINEIRIKDGMTGFLFFKKPTEKIEILTQNPETPSYYNPVEYFKHQEKDYFEEYIKDLEQYAKEKSVTLLDQRKNN